MTDGPYQTTAASLARSPAFAPRLVVLDGPNRGALLPLVAGENRVGRDPGNEVCLPDRLISRQHAMVVLRPEGALLTDLQSTNATYLNGLRVTGPRDLQHGDELRLGKTMLLFVGEEEETPAGGTPMLELEETLRLPADAAEAGAPPGSGTSVRRRRARTTLGPERRAPCLVGDSSALQRVSELVARCAPLGTTVLIRGESGTGKELVAESLHRLAPRRDQPFVIVNCATLEPQLLESELFGHEQGSFTGALARRLGKLELAGAGTIFLDEVGELPAGAQAKLLRAIDTRKFERLGGGEMLTTRARFVAATHRDLEAMVEAGTFREDLLFRLRIVEITIPPLRERPDDVEPLVEYFITELRQTIPAKARVVTREALQALKSHPFPGNVRELRNILERCLIFSEKEVLDAEDLFPQARAQPPAGSQAGRGSDGRVLSLDELEREQIQVALQETGGNKTHAAKLLGIDRVTLYAKLKRHGIES